MCNRYYLGKESRNKVKQYINMENRFVSILYDHNNLVKKYNTEGIKSDDYEYMSNDMEYQNLQDELKRYHFFKNASEKITDCEVSDIIDKIPYSFDGWLEEINLCKLEFARQQTTKEMIETIDLIINTSFSNKMISDSIKKAEPALHEIREKLNFQLIERQQKTIHGYDCVKIISDQQINDLLKQMSDYWDAKPESFKAMFRSKSIVLNFKKPIWKKKQSHLRDFWELIGITPTQSILDGIITDEKNNRIWLSKRKGTSAEYCAIKRIFDDLLIPTH